jgi:pimeloyl-ACP methyl ester carboxylesterase
MPKVTANGIKIHYEERGEGDPLILIMGLGADGSLWEDHRKSYEKHFRCIMMDNRGSGQSDKPNGPYTTRMMAEDTAGLMDALGIEKAHVNGISMGGAIAQMLALEYPEKVRSLVLVSTWARCDTYAKVVFDHFRSVRPRIEPKEFMQLLQLWIFAAPYYQKHQEDLIQGQQDAQDNKDALMPDHAFDAQCEACINHDTLHRLGDIIAPTLITIGDADIFTPFHFSQTLHDGISGSEMLVFKDCGHAHHWEDLLEFNSKTTGFLLKH